MDLPAPTFSFSIPSIHDGVKLECRVYLPNELRNIQPARASTSTASTGRSSWKPRGAIIAHPYTRLGGCYDDPVVSFVGGELLQAGYLVGTFNFRCIIVSPLSDLMDDQLTPITVARGVLRGRPAGLPSPNWKIMSHSTGLCCYVYGS
jgi:hypothetical protein